MNQSLPHPPFRPLHRSHMADKHPNEFVECERYTIYAKANGEFFRCSEVSVKECQLATCPPFFRGGNAGDRIYGSESWCGHTPASRVRSGTGLNPLRLRFGRAVHVGSTQPDGDRGQRNRPGGV